MALCNNRRKILKITLILFLIAISFVVAFVVQTLSMLPPIAPDFLTQYVKSDSSLVLEKESFVNFDELEAFYLFGGNSKTFTKWLADEKDAGALELKDNKNIFLNQDILLSDSYRNDCEVIYCYGERIPFQKMPGVLWRGLIGIEDGRFLEHSGVDPKSIMRAIVTDIKTLSLAQGGSTITQQLVKNLFFSSEKKFIRKLREFVVAIYLEVRFEKEKILETYFNEIDWGSLQGIRIRGIQAASLFYFSKKVDELSPYESAILISLLKGPSFYHPLRHTERLKERVAIVVKKLLELDLFPDGVDIVWNDKKWNEWIVKLKEKDRTRNFYWQWISRHAHSDEHSTVISPYEKFIFTKKAGSILNMVKEKNPGVDLAVKAVIKNLKINTDGFFYYSKYERNKNQALNNEKHQVGSTLKPILYLFYLKEGKNFDDLVSTVAPTLKLKSGEWKPREATRIKVLEVTLEEALQKSFNAPVINLAQEIGFHKVENYLSEIIPNLLRPLQEYPAQLLGSVELSLLELVNIYHFFIKEDCRYAREQATKGVLEVMSDPKLTTIRRRVGTWLQEMNFFGKTGTSNSGLDNWFVFFDGINLGAIWLGLEGPREGVKLNLYGSSTAFEIFQSYVLDRGRRFPEFYCEG